MVMGLAMLLAPVCVVSQNAIDSIDQKFSRYDLHQVVITATRTPKALKDVPVATRLITANEIERTDATNVQELLQQALPGLEYTYSYNQQPILDFQGFGGSSVLFLVDGERMAGETMDNVDFYRLSMLGVERMEIVKGASSCLYGSSAMGGVVNLISSQPRKPFQLRLNGKIGAHGEQRYGGIVGVNCGRILSTTRFQYTTIDDIDLRKPGQITAGDFSNIVGNTTYNLDERLVYNVNDKLSFTARGGYFFRERNSSPIVTDYHKDASFGLRGDYRLSELERIELSYSFDRYDKGPFDKNTSTYSRTYSNRQNIGRACYFAEYDSVLNLTVGSEIFHDYLQSYQFTDSGSHSQNDVSVFAQADWRVMKRVSLLAGLRYDYFSAASMQHISPQASLMYSLPHLNLRGGYAHGYRAPSLKEMFMDFDMPVFWIFGNKDLKPELSHNFQLSAEYYRGCFSFMLIGFHNIVQNRISTAWFADLNGHRYINMDAMSISGLDANLSLNTDFGLSVTGGYTYTHESISRGLPINVSCRPHSAMLRVDYGRRYNRFSFNVGLSGRILSAMECDEFNAVGDLTVTVHRRYPGYMLWKLQASARYSVFSLTLAVDNILNYIPDYYYIKSPITTGRTYSASLTIDID